MHSVRFCLISAALTLVSLYATAQSKATGPWSAMLGGQANYLSSHNHALLLRGQLERSFDTDFNALDKRTGGGQLQRAVALVGYEWLLSERWTGGLIEKVTFEPGPTRSFQTGGFLRHSGHIGSVQFRKRALVEHVVVDNLGEHQPNTGRARFRVDFDRTWLVGRIGLRPRVAYEIQFDIAFKSTDAAGSPSAEKRTVDRALLRAELALDLTEHLSVVPYVLRRTEFTTAVGTFNQDGSVQVPKGPRNLRYPTVGVDVRFTLPTGRMLVRTLPTFEGYQD
jgi:hypothetical protein